MLSLRQCCRAWVRTVCASKVPVCHTTAAFMPVYNPVQTISSTCSVNAPVDRDDSFTKYPRWSERTSINGASILNAGGGKARRDKRKHLGQGGKIVLPLKPLSVEEWNSRKLEDKGYEHYEELVMDNMIQTNADINIAKSLLSYVAAKEGDVPYKLLLKYLVLCVQQRQTQEIYDMCDILKSKFGTLDSSVNSLLIKGLSDTDRWREAIAFLESFKKTGDPSARNYTECIKGAIKHRQKELAWTLYDEMLHKGLIPSEDCIKSLFHADDDLQDETFRKRLLDLLTYFRENQIYPEQPLMEAIKAWFERTPNETWKGQLTRVNDNGHCQACKQKLESIHLTPGEYDTLKKEVIDSVLKGEDIFRKTTPNELQKFLQFVDSQKPYDIVVDGLNVAYLSRKHSLSGALLSVVSKLAARGKRILVLGRMHMLLNCKRWAREDIHRLQNCADCFFLDNISLDDPFLLYACINSGSHCCFISSDLLRDHKACLPNPEIRRLFFKWQRGHQLMLPLYSHGNVNLRPILMYDTILQNTKVSWHIPYDEMGIKRASYEVPKTWLCLKKIS